MTTNNIKWKEEVEELLLNIYDRGHSNKPCQEEIDIVQAFILSTLQKYAEGVEKVIGEDEVPGLVPGYFDVTVPEAKDKLRAKQRQSLHKLNTTYGLKGEK